MFKHQRGMALLMVLLLMATLAAVVSIAQSWGVDALRRTSSIQTQQHEKWALLGAETLILNQYAKFLTADVSKPDLKWIRNPFEFSIDDNRFHFQVKDLQTCFNLNAVFMKKNSKEQVQSEAVRVFKELLTLTGSDVKQAEEIVKMVTHQGKKAGYLFSDSRELNAIIELPLLQRKLLQPLICALPVTDLKININGLTEQHALLLHALTGAPLESTNIRAFFSTRPTAGWDSIEALKKSKIPNELLPAISAIEPLLSTNSTFYELDIKAEKSSSLSIRTWLSNDENGLFVYGREFPPTMQ